MDKSEAYTRLVASGCLLGSSNKRCTQCGWLCEWRQTSKLTDRQTNRQISSSLKAPFTLVSRAPNNANVIIYHETLRSLPRGDINTAARCQTLATSVEGSWTVTSEPCLAVWTQYRIYDVLQTA